MSDTRIPLLFLGDSPSGHTGLGRILRDSSLKTQEHMSDVFDVAVLGGGAPPDRKRFPNLQQYRMMRVEDWLVHDLPYVWEAHAGGRDGIIFCIWDVSRLLWMAYPEQCPDASVKEFLLNFKGKKWIYPAVDGASPTVRMSTILQDALSKFDRVVNYTQFSANITGYPDVLPHGIDTKVFYRRPDARRLMKKFGIQLEPGEYMIGIVATNQPRKDWAMAFGALALLKQKGIKARVWIHTDTEKRSWDLQAMYIDFGLQPDIKMVLTAQQLPSGEIVGLNLPDEDLAMLYSACDVTVGIGPEGFGYPIAESLCCGTPCVTGEYGGQADYVPACFLVKPMAFRYEGGFSVQRPVYNSADFAKKIELLLRDSGLTSGYRDVSPVCSWDDVWPLWKSWLLEGVR